MLSDYSRDTYFAPELSKLTACGALELLPREGEWLSRFSLGTIFFVRVTAPHKLYSFAYLRKVEAALEEYEIARSTLLDYVDGRSDSKYFSALRHFENCLAMTYQAMLVVQGMAKTEGQRKRNEKGPNFYEPGDGSLSERINWLYNDGKHIDGTISRGDFPHDHATVVIWLTNDGIKSTRCVVTFQELRELLLDLAKWADEIVKSVLRPDPGSDG